MIPEAVLRVIEDAGHLVIEEKPDELVKEIFDFAQAQELHNLGSIYGRWPDVTGSARTEAEILSRRSRGRLGAVGRPRPACTIGIVHAGRGCAQLLTLYITNDSQYY